MSKDSYAELESEMLDASQEILEIAEKLYEVNKLDVLKTGQYTRLKQAAKQVFYNSSCLKEYGL